MHVLKSSSTDATASIARPLTDGGVAVTSLHAVAPSPTIPVAAVALTGVALKRLVVRAIGVSARCPPGTEKAKLGSF